MQGKKKVFTNKEINIFKTDDNKITVQAVLDSIEKSDIVLRYLPDKPEEYANHKGYLFAIVHTIDSTFFKRLVAQREKARAA